ncbi:MULTISPECIES: hypothetical protein [Deinococcus]|uniref:hypothetical protein n=1 Tax=Deinococcus TaxID=1298 RepID=UPI0004862366|nr:MULTISPECIES: hypothetical protein [Deinococcus]KEF33986.1 cell division protein FtsB [Deinococcus sp. RL]
MSVPEPPPSPERRGWRSRWRRLQRLPVALVVASLLSALGIVQLSFQLGNLVYRTVTWQGETRAAEERIRALERDVRVLREAEAAALDPAYLEVLARCQGFVGENEELVVAENAPDAPGEICHTLRLP